MCFQPAYERPVDLTLIQHTKRVQEWTETCEAATEEENMTFEGWLESTVATYKSHLYSPELREFSTAVSVYCTRAFEVEIAERHYVKRKQNVKPLKTTSQFKDARSLLR